MRFDGGHKRDSFLTDVLSRHVSWVRVSPEVEVGMGTPRETLRLVRSADGGVRMITTRTGIDHTDAMSDWSRRRLAELEGETLSGYVLKKDSPSCGLEAVTVFDHADVPHRTGRGLFADALVLRYPNLPVEDEGRLSDPVRRENFVERVFAYQRLRRFFEGRWAAGVLAGFHAAHEMTLLAHSPRQCRELGALVASAAGRPHSELRAEYESRFMQTLALLTTRRGHSNVLVHMAGHLEGLLDDRARQELTTAIEAYRRGQVDLRVPLTLLADHARSHEVAYLLKQTYLEPYPRELMMGRV